MKAFVPRWSSVPVGCGQNPNEVSRCPDSFEDVYKRQSVQIFCFHNMTYLPLGFPRLSGIVEEVGYLMTRFVSVPVAAVSYTHLDVYKRQELINEIPTFS